ncbi:YciI family protein [Cohnella abietis]|uniref:YCII-related domain-containing protein n=1 Tax=Cohnella abietis TaxID=2507935 RepID=A0A3T1D683_9BACL|nr:YciI family protein [Cohnella abietis]BBI33586.1 hypothetical protein KCTCHS21_29850 [Cohnella abietis]
MSVYAVIVKFTDHSEASTYLQEHIAYLAELREKGIVLANGRLLEGWGGINLFRGSLDEVRVLVERDPFVLHGIFTYELFEWDVRWSPAVEIH